MAKLDTPNSKGKLRSPMSGFQANENHRTPGIGTTEMQPDARLNKPNAAPVQSPQMPFKVSPTSGVKKK